MIRVHLSEDVTQDFMPLDDQTQIEIVDSRGEQHSGIYLWPDAWARLEEAIAEAVFYIDRAPVEVPEA